MVHSTDCPGWIRTTCGIERRCRSRSPSRRTPRRARAASRRREHRRNDHAATRSAPRQRRVVASDPARTLGMGPWPRNASRASTRASCTWSARDAHARRGRLGVRAAGGRSAHLRGRAAGRRGAPAPGARACGSGCCASPGTSRVRSGSTTTGSTSTSTCAAPRSRHRVDGSSSSARSAGCSRARSIRSKPLWELYVFEGLAEDRTAVLLKLHHALADGIGGMLIGSALFDLQPDAPLGAPAQAAWVAEPTPSRDGAGARRDPRTCVLHPLEAFADAARSAATRARLDRTHPVGDGLDLSGWEPPPRGPFDAKIEPARRFATAEVAVRTAARDQAHARGHGERRRADRGRDRSARAAGRPRRARRRDERCA